MKKTLLILLAIIFAINLNTQAEDFSAVLYNGDTIYYNITSSTSPRTVAVTYRGAFSSSYSNEYSGDISIPDSVFDIYSWNYYKVTSIGDYAFFDCSGLTSITIPNSVTSIGNSAFLSCSGLTSITIPNSVTSIGEYAFRYCSGLTSITIPNSVTSIGSATFDYCSGLASLTIGNSVISIGDEAFYYCSGLTSIIIPNSVTSIGDRAFYNCTGLTSITIGNSVTSIGDRAFYNCTGLTSITIPNSLTSIDGGAFSGCTGLTSITIPNSVTSISGGAFSGCTSLTSITIPNSVTSIGGFSGCTGLTSITIPNSVTSISGFSGCTGLTSITIPNSVISIGSGAFRGCTGLTSVTIGNSVTSIGNDAFSSCTSLTSITIPNSVTSISGGALGGGAFYNCTSLDTVYFNANNCYSMGTSTSYSFNGCFNFRTLIIGDSVQNIPSYAFYNCNSLTSITIPNSVTSIGNYAFKNCTSLDTVYFNANNCYSMGTSTYYVFNGCFNFRTLIIGDSVQNIPSYAFYNCNSLTSITSKAINPPAVWWNSFSGVSKTIPFNLPCISIQSYQSNSNWNEFTNKIGGSPRAAQFITTSICQGETYTDYGANINTAGDYTLVNGCDSVILNLSIKPTFQTDYYDTICKGQNYNNYGFSFVADTSGIYKYNLQAVNSCDSVICLNLFVNPIYNDTIIAEICNGETYSQFGFNENTAGFYTQSLQTIKGCDSIVNLNLIINPIYNDTILAEICSNETYTLNGFNVNTAGFYTQNLQTIKGCDSVVNLNLIVNPIYLTNHFDTICKGQLYNNYGFNFTSDTSGFYTQNLQTIKGCDSIINLNLIVNPIYNDTIIAEICNGETYSQFGFNENTAGFYTQSLQTIKGCDSIVCLSLVVREPIKVNLTMVTVDNNNNNVVVWDKDEVVNHYNIYREGNVANQFDLIASVPYDSASMFVDTNSNPTIKAYMYKISTTDTCLNESELSPLHKTMHLTISQGTGNNWNLNWTPYVGANYSSYNIYRGINSLDSLQFLTTISSSNTSYTDINVPSGYVYYQIEIIIDTAIQTKTGENNSIRSNYATNKLISIEGVQTTDNIRTKLYPNPSDGKAILDVEGLNTEADVLVYDMVGRIVQRHSLNKGKNDLEIDLSGYAKGVYSVRIVNESVNQTLKLVVQ